MSRRCTRACFGAAAVALAVSGCSRAPGPVAVLTDAGLEAGRADATADAAPDAAAPGLCPRWCAAVDAACGAGAGDCEADCLVRLETLRPACLEAFAEHFACLLETRAWSCVSPGVVRREGCTESEDAWRACDP